LGDQRVEWHIAADAMSLPAGTRGFLAVVPEVVAKEQPLTVVLDWTAEIAR
jgi:hypothetical protein